LKSEQSLIDERDAKEKRQLSTLTGAKRKRDKSWGTIDGEDTSVHHVGLRWGGEAFSEKGLGNCRGEVDLGAGEARIEQG